MSQARKPALILAVAVMVAAAAIGSSAAPAAVGGGCGSFTGPAWKAERYGKKGTIYEVFDNTKGLCAFALSWSKKLVRRPSHGSGTPLPGPGGWRCSVDAAARYFTGARAVVGRCRKGYALFGWLPKVH